LPRAARGELWLIDLGTPLGHEQGFTRPAVVVSHDGLNGSATDLVIVIPVTRTRRTLPGHVEIEAVAGTGLSDTSYAQAEQVRSVTTNRLVRRLSAVDAITLTKVEQALRRMLGL
jgi:mRNA interferase MazF